jgi:hypothetical protein
LEFDRLLEVGMGAHAYHYIVQYQPNINAALQELRQTEFQAGRYNPVMMFPEFPVLSDSPAPGPQHASIEEAFEASEADGTRSILDIERIGGDPDYRVAAPLPAETLISLFGTAQPTREMVEENLDFFEDIERGKAIYVVLYADGRPSEILFAGYSFD